MTDTTQGSGRRPRTEKKKANGVLTFLRDLVIIFVAALLVSFLVKTFLIRSFYIPSASMENTLQINDRVIVNELVPDVVSLKRGDVVVFKDPGDGSAAPMCRRSLRTRSPRRPSTGS
ncbi:hypothetical protein GCM10009706_11890 [Curtobacterium citreum]|nr:hypothetical protein GCM10009706_11890 [Curtobacterium citreum]